MNIRRIIYLVSGTVFLILGIIGLALPVIPQVPFLLLAAFFLSKGSGRIGRWISGLPVYRKFFPGKTGGETPDPVSDAVSDKKTDPEDRHSEVDDDTDED